jgi:beta-glucosidase
MQLLISNMTQDEAIGWLNDAVPAMPRLGLPSYSWESEGIHGVSWAGVSTVFPSPLAWAASFNVPLAAAAADVIATEARAKWKLAMAADGSTGEFSGLSFMMPVANLYVDPRWGR